MSCREGSFTQNNLLNHMSTKFIEEFIHDTINTLSKTSVVCFFAHALGEYVQLCTTLKAAGHDTSELNAAMLETEASIVKLKAVRKAAVEKFKQSGVLFTVVPLEKEEVKEEEPETTKCRCGFWHPDQECGCDLWRQDHPWSDQEWEEEPPHCDLWRQDHPWSDQEWEEEPCARKPGKFIVLTTSQVLRRKMQNLKAAGKLVQHSAA